MPLRICSRTVCLLRGPRGGFGSELHAPNMKPFPIHCDRIPNNGLPMGGTNTFEKEAIVTAAEIHSMRDATFAVGQVMWSRGKSQTAWTMPNIFAVGVDGKLAE